MEETKIALTKSGYEKTEKELRELIDVVRPQVIEELKAARAQGDLSENADYDAARNNQARIASEIKETEQALKVAVVISGEEGNNLGKFVDVNFLDEGVVETYHIVGTIEADPLAQKISDESPLGKAIIHSKVGDRVLVKTEDGEQFEVKIERISEKDPTAVPEKKRTTKKK